MYPRSLADVSGDRVIASLTTNLSYRVIVGEHAADSLLSNRQARLLVTNEV
jgi:hypothetical protein